MKISQSVIKIDEKSARFGILTKPQSSDLNNGASLVIFLNPGITYRIGSNRIHVKLAQKLAQKGYFSFRFDFSTMEESSANSNDYTFEQSFVKDTLQVIDYFETQHNVKSFYLMGMCSGAMVAFESALTEKRIKGIVLINAFFTNDEDSDALFDLAVRKLKVNYYKKNLFDLKRWKKVFTGKSQIFKNFKKLTPQKSSSDSDKDFFTNSPIELLIRSGIKIAFVFSEGSLSMAMAELSIFKQLQELKSQGIIDLYSFKNTDHTFTPVASQGLLFELVLNFLEKYDQAESKVYDLYQEEAVAL